MSCNELAEIRPHGGHMSRARNDNKFPLIRQLLRLVQDGGANKGARRRAANGYDENV